MDTAGKAMGAAAKGMSEAGAELEGVPIVGEILGTAVEVVSAFINILAKIFTKIGAMEKKSAEERGKFTRDTVAAFVKAHPGWHVVVAYQKDKHNFFGQGTEGKDWSHTNTDTHTVLGKYKYDVYGLHAGIFILEGDGGFENWAYMSGPDVETTGDQNHRLIFKGAAPKDVPSGPIHLHFYEYNKGADGKNPHVDLVTILYSGPKIIGFQGDGNLGGAPISVGSQLHDPFLISATKKDDKDAPLDIVYKGKHTLSSSGACKMGSYDHGKIRQGDCTIAA